MGPQPSRLASIVAGLQLTGIHEENAGVMLTLNLYGMSSLFKNAVGFLYLSEDETTLKVSFLDFWGKRIDKEFPVEDVIPFLDAPCPPTDYMYKQLVFYSTDKTKLKLFVKLGKITSKDKFDKVFGPLEKQNV